jgi:uncharacterized protein
MMSAQQVDRNDIKWIEPVFAEPSSEDGSAEARSHTAEEGTDEAGAEPRIDIDASDPAPEREAEDAAGARITRLEEASTPSAKPRRARSRRIEDRKSPASPDSKRRLAPGMQARQAKIATKRGSAVARTRQLEEAFGAEREAAVREIATLQSTLAAEREAAAARINRLEETFDAEREAAAGAIAALRNTLLAERALAVVRITWLEEARGAEGAAAPDEIAKLPNALPAERGSAVARIARLDEAFDATPRRNPISLLWRNRRLVVRDLALAAVALGVITYYSSDIWSARALQSPSNAGAAVVDATALPPDKQAWSSLGGPPGDPVERVVYLRDHAQAGDPAAQYALGVLYAQGEDVAQDYATAASWFGKAAKNGIVNAQDLARLYERGLVTPSDLVVATYWYHNAAVQGIVPAMIQSAALYEQGQGVGASPVIAYAWYRAAARRGDALAEKRAVALFQQFTGAERGRAVTQAAALVDALHEPRVASAARLLPGSWIGDTTAEQASQP